jgi:membrane-associated phospholipid phosphatase
MTLANALRPYLVALSFALVLLLRASHARAADPDRVEWTPDWSRFRLAEGIGTLALGAEAIAVAVTAEPPSHASWTGGILFFYSGHAAATATMAGLTCAHHQHLPLYGGGFADLAPCLAMIGVSLGAGATRIMADRHWASDVLTGWTVGALSGYVLPSALHYGFGGGRPIGEMRVGGAHVVPMPLAYLGGAGLGLVGSY